MRVFSKQTISLTASQSRRLAGRKYFCSQVVVPAALVKELRSVTGAGILECKKALQESNLKMDDALENLRKKGAATVSKLSSRESKESLLSLSVSEDSRAVALIELTAETDFVIRNEKFQGLATRLSNNFLQSGTILSSGLSEEDLANLPLSDSCDDKVSDAIEEVMSVIKENITLRKLHSFRMPEGTNGSIGYYIHNKHVEGLGERVAFVSLESDADPSDLAEIGKQISMHIVAANPEYLNIEDVPLARRESESDIAKELASSTGKKPANVLEKIVNGKLAKVYKDICLMEQDFILGDVLGDKKKVSIKELIAMHESRLGKSIKILNFTLLTTQ